MKLSIAIDMGAKNNGVFIVKTDGNKIVEKKATTIIIDKNSINFSKKSRRENRHRVRSYTRRKLAKRLFWEFFDKNLYTKAQQELLQGLFNNRGYTHLSVDNDFEEISLKTIEFLEIYFQDLKECKSKEDFLKLLDNLDEENVVEWCNEIIDKLNIEYKKTKTLAPKDFKDDWSKIKQDLKNIRDLYLNVKKEIETGSKHRKTYLKEINKEIQNFDFFDDKFTLYNLVGNISNLQLRILRKLFNSKDRYQKLKNYFLTFHYKSNEEKERRKELFRELNKYKSLEDFLKNTNPLLTIPPYEDMNNRNTYKCNSILIKEKAALSLKDSIDILKNQPEFEVLKLNNLSYAKKLQRILDINSKIIDKSKHPREVFKYNKGDYTFYKNLLNKNYENFKEFAKKYYEMEELVLNGIFNEDDNFYICKTNTPYKNNIKHILLKPLYSYEFREDEVNQFVDKIKNTYGLKSYLEKISKNAKEYQNNFYNVIKSCYEDNKCVADKEIKSIVTNLDKKLKDIQTILDELKIDSNLKDLKLNNNNLTKVLNIFKQTYEVLFKDINGFSKTCKNCSIENSIRSDEAKPIAKRLLSDVAKPIDGMLDMLLDRLAFEIVKEIDTTNVNEIEILLEQNRFEFEENLLEIKGKKAKREDKDILNSEYCAYTGEKFIKGDWDHIIPQSKDLRNSKANMIYVSIKGNREKGNKYYTLENLSKEHLKDIFKTDDLNKIKEFIKTNLPKKENFKNFDALRLKEQIALRYALFMRGTLEYQKAYEIVKNDKLKTITNGTQKRLARLIQEKLNQNIKITSKVIDNKLVSATRKELAVDSITGEVNHLLKEEKQDSHSHCIDAMVVFYLNNMFSFDEIYTTSNEKKVKKSTIKERIKENKKINSIASTEVLFRENMLSNHYFNIFFKDEKYFYGENIKNSIEFKGFKKKHFEYLKDKNILSEFSKNQFSINKKLLYQLLFNDKNEVISNYAIFKKIDDLRYTTQKKSIISLLDKFIKKYKTLDDFNEENLFKEFIKINTSQEQTKHKNVRLKIFIAWEKLIKELLEEKEKIITQNDKTISINYTNLSKVLSKSIIFKKTHLTKRKITKEFSLPLKDTTDRPFLIRRKNNNGEFIYQVVFAKNSARGFVDDIYIHKGHKNIIPLKMEDYKKAFEYETHNYK